MAESSIPSFYCDWHSFSQDSSLLAYPIINKSSCCHCVRKMWLGLRERAKAQCFFYFSLPYSHTSAVCLFRSLSVTHTQRHTRSVYSRPCSITISPTIFSHHLVLSAEGLELHSASPFTALSVFWKSHTQPSVHKTLSFSDILPAVYALRWHLYSSCSDCKDFISLDEREGWNKKVRGRQKQESKRN